MSHSGIASTGERFALGAFLLVGAMIDTLAGLRFAPERDDDGKQGERYAAFVHEFFPERYRELNVGPVLWRSLRCGPLHNFSSEDLVFAEHQSHLHLGTVGGTALNWEDFFADYGHALYAYWNALEDDPVLQENAATRCERYPPFTLRILGGASFPITFPLAFGSGSVASEDDDRAGTAVARRARHVPARLQPGAASSRDHSQKAHHFGGIHTAVRGAELVRRARRSAPGVVEGPRDQ
jgi:hypothetical protein